ncbi:transporter substrate-binding domain-containing protein [Vibrio sp. ZSDE26]|uniref:Transporter substrate-binding domain-containing protein n=1 Tax=Vibrio amylolyticus TaxID=2847292 RepID=A0A9X2BGB6_9VIBR|nr:transporter substrate-binding domain-containing protein [Vibrio amylolyticus]MCK6261695.1 transporter substrate-binding domain-containing protein [Vibrio amylolyticus]
MKREWVSFGMSKGFLISFIFLLVPATTSAEPYTVGSYYIPGLVMEDGSGLFLELHEEILLRAELDVETKIHSTKRIQKLFKNDALLAYFPELWENVPKKREEVIVTDPIWLKRIVLYSLEDTMNMTVSELEYMSVGAVEGYSYGEEIVGNEAIKIEYADNDDINVDKLLKGRIDIIVGDDTSTLNAIKDHPKGHLIKYDVNYPISVLDVFYVCQNTSRGMALCGEISSAIQSVMQDGILRLNKQTGESIIDVSNPYWRSMAID